MYSQAVLAGAPAGYVANSQTATKEVLCVGRLGYTACGGRGHDVSCTYLMLTCNIPIPMCADVHAYIVITASIANATLRTTILMMPPPPPQQCLRLRPVNNGTQSHSSYFAFEFALFAPCLRFVRNCPFVLLRPSLTFFTLLLGGDL